MFRCLTSIAVVLFLTSFDGCAPKETPVTPLVDDSGGTDKNGILPGDLGPQEKGQADSEHQFAAKEKELGHLKANADSFDAPIDKAENVYTLSPELFDGMPEGDFPKAGAGFDPERDAANTWFKKNRVGKQVEWKSTITVDSSKEGEHYVLYVAVPLERSMEGFGSILFKKKFSADEFEIIFDKPYFEYHVDGATLKKVRDTWHNKEVTLRSTITGSVCYLAFNVKPQWRIAVSPPTIDGYAPPLVKE